MKSPIRLLPAVAALLLAVPASAATPMPKPRPQPVGIEVPMPKPRIGPVVPGEPIWAAEAPQRCFQFFRWRVCFAHPR